MSVECSFDDGPAENCSFPLVVGIDRFGTDNHTVVVTVVDEFGQSLDIPFGFRLIERKFTYILRSLIIFNPLLQLYNLQ